MYDMYVRLLKGKIHRATVTDAELNYEGSVAIDRALMDAAGLLPYEQVDILNINNGARFTTYVIEGRKNSGIIGIRGAGARLAQPGDLVIICAYCNVEQADAKKHKPKTVMVDSKNRVSKTKRKSAK